MAVVKNAQLSVREIWNAVFDNTNNILRVHSGSGPGPTNFKTEQYILNRCYDSTNKELKTR